MTQAPTDAPTTTSPAKLAEDCKASHNKYRDLHKDTSNIEWNATLATECQEWANHLVGIDKMEHSSAEWFGENLYWRSGGDVSCDMAVKAW